MLIYCITNATTGTRYVGQTRYTAECRWKTHCKESEIRHKTRKNHPFYNAILKYGKSAFSVDILQKCATLEECNEAEVFWIKYLNTLVPNGYNIATGGKRSPASEEHLRRMSIARKGKPMSEKNRLALIGIKRIYPHGRPKPQLGKARPDWVRKKISESLKGKPKPPVTDAHRLANKMAQIRYHQQKPWL